MARHIGWTIIIGIAGLLLGGCSLQIEKSGIEILSYPPAKVFIDGKEAGVTPYRNTSLKPGEKEIRLQAGDRLWQKKVEMKNGINTVIDWEFGSSDEDSGGYVLYMEKTGDKNRSGLMAAGAPDRSVLKIDQEIKGFLPIKIDDVGQGDRQVSISFPGYKEMEVFVKARPGYQLVIEASLAKEKVTMETRKPLVPTPTQSLEPKVTIRQTETGWLRVREASSSASREIKKVNPGEEYTLLEENQDWYKIDLGDGTNGWISSAYAEKID